MPDNLRYDLESRAPANNTMPMVAASETSEPSSGIPSTQRGTYEDTGEGFERAYLAMLAEVLARGLPTAICTVYYPRFPEAALRKVAVVGLTVFNDCIVRAAFAHGLPLLDLHRGRGLRQPDRTVGAGRREEIARAVVGFVQRGPTGGRTEVFV